MVQLRTLVRTCLDLRQVEHLPAPAAAQLASVALPLPSAAALALPLPSAASLALPLPLPHPLPLPSAAASTVRRAASASRASSLYTSKALGLTRLSRQEFGGYVR